MDESAPPTRRYQLADLGSSRMRARSGDVFVARPQPDSFVVGRVISTTARWALQSDSGTCLLLHIYKGLLPEALALQPHNLPDSHFSAENLLINPVLTNQLAWRRGVFKTVGERAIEDDLPAWSRTFFHRSTKTFINDEAREVEAPLREVGSWGLSGYPLIEEAINNALIPVAREQVMQPEGVFLDLVRERGSTIPDVANKRSVSAMRIWHCGYRSLKPLTEFTNLRVLEIGSYPESDLSALGSLSNLEYLRIHRMPKVRDLEGLIGLDQLQTLSLEAAIRSRNVQTVESLSPLARLGSLKHLELDGIVDRTGSLDELEQSVGLTTLRANAYPRSEVNRFLDERSVSFEPPPVAHVNDWLSDGKSSS